MLTFSNQSVTACNFNGQPVTSLYFNGNLVWSAAHTVYYVIAGAVHTETKNMGADCLTPSTFTPSVDGATFQGWSETPGVASVLTSKTMGTSDITLYAVYTYNNYLLDGTGIINAEAAEESENGFIRYIDGTKYYTISFTYDLGHWSGDGGSWLKIKNSSGAIIWEITDDNGQGTANVNLPLEVGCIVEGHCWQTESGGARCKITNAIVYGRQLVG